MANEITFHLDKEYRKFFAEIKEQVKTSQIRAALAVNKEVIAFYWYLGNQILEKQKTAQWGSKLINQLSHDLQNTFPGVKGFSVSNLKRMNVFAREYPDFKISPQLVGQLPWGAFKFNYRKTKK